MNELAPDVSLTGKLFLAVFSQVFRPIRQGITILTLVSVGLLIQAIVLMAPLKQAIPTSQS